MSFDIEVERDVIAVAMKDAEFLRAAEPVLQSHSFENPVLGWAWKRLSTSYAKTCEIPDARAWAGWAGDDFRKDSERDLAVETLVRLWKRKPAAIKTSLERMREFVRMTVIRRAVGGALDGLDAGDIEAASAALTAGIEDERGALILDDARDFDDIDDRLSVYTTEDKRPRCKTGFETINKITNGGPPAGTVSIISALTNVGKSTIVVDIGMHGLLSNRKAHLVHLCSEETRLEATARYDAWITRIPRDVLTGGRMTRAQIADFKSIHERAKRAGLAQRIHIHEVPPKSSIGVAKSIVQGIRAKYPGVLLIVVADSADHWTPIGKVENFRLGMSDVYWTLKGMSVNKSLAPLLVWATTQAPKEYKKKKLDDGAVSETYDKARIADFLVGAMEGEDYVGDEEEKAIQLIVLKNRLGRIKYWRIYVQCNMGLCRAEETANESGSGAASSSGGP